MRAACLLPGGLVEYRDSEILAKRGRKFGSQIQSPDREGGVCRFDARHAGSLRHVTVRDQITAMGMHTLRLALFALVACLASSLPLQGDEISWYDNYDEAIREAKRTGKPIFLEFRCER